MTKDEAIHFAECLKNNWTINLDDLKDFCDMAIEALGEKKNKNAEPIPQWQIECVSFEFRSNQVSNWLRIIRYDGTAETIHRIAVVRSINLQ